MEWPTDWPWAWGEPSCDAVMRETCADFEVTEELGFPLAGEGEHALLFIEKENITTDQLSRTIAALARVDQSRIGFCGLKDRRAVCRQYFSVGLAGAPEPDWSLLEQRGIRVLDVVRHRKKLRRGVHKRNHFRLRLRRISGDQSDVERRLQQILENGVPNYFGAQRFGYNFQNLLRCERWMVSSKAPHRREERSIILSAGRSWLFNTCLARCVEEGTWNHISEGDVCALAGSHSMFIAGATDEFNERQLNDRHADGDIHRGIPLWGSGESSWRQKSAIMENQPLADWLCRQRLKLEYRPARLLPDDFSWEFCDDGDLQLDFALPAGGYATTVVRELVHLREAGGDQTGNNAVREGE